MPHYEVAYGFEGHVPGDSTEVIERSFSTLDELQARGIEISCRGATVDLDADGAVSEVVARYAAPTEGHVALLTVEARLPVSGIQRVERERSADTDRDPTAVPA